MLTKLTVEADGSYTPAGHEVVLERQGGALGGDVHDAPRQLLRREPLGHVLGEEERRLGRGAGRSRSGTKVRNRPRGSYV